MYFVNLSPPAILFIKVYVQSVTVFKEQVAFFIVLLKLINLSLTLHYGKNISQLSSVNYPKLN